MPKHDWTEEEPKEEAKEEIVGKKEIKSPSKPIGQKPTDAAKSDVGLSGGEKKGSKKPKTIEEVFNPANVNKFLAWVPKQDARLYPRQKAVINQFKAYNKGNTFIQLLDLFQIFLSQE